MFFAAEIAVQHDGNAKIERLYRLVYNRPPAHEEYELARAFLGQVAIEPGRWRSYVQALLMANEFVYVD